MEPFADGGMRIGEVAERLGLNPRTIRYYEGIGLLPEPERTPGGYRLYTAEDLDRLRFVIAAQRLGLSLDEIGEVLALRDQGARPCSYVRDVLAREVASIDRRIRELRELRGELRTLEAKADQLASQPGAICGIIEHVQPDQQPQSRRSGRRRRRSLSPLEAL